MTVAAVSRRAGVSRTFLYSNPEARALLADATADARARRAQDLAGHDAGPEATWRERVRAAAQSRSDTPAIMQTGMICMAPSMSGAGRRICPARRCPGIPVPPQEHQPDG